MLGLLLSACGGGNGGSGPTTASTECPSTYSITLLPIGSFASSNSVSSINSSSQIVGEINGNAVLWDGGSVFALGNLGGLNSSANDINDSTQIVGISETSTSNVNHAFLFFFTTGMMTDLGTLGGSNSLASGINNSGQITGSSQILGDAARHAFLHSGGTMIDLGTLGGTTSHASAINNVGQIVGNSQTFSNAANHAFLYENGTMKDIGTLGGADSTAFDINDSGQIVGSSKTSSDTDDHAFLYNDGKMLNISPGTLSAAGGINSKGHVVGRFASSSSPTGWHPFRYCGGALTDLNDLLAGPSSWQLLGASDINDKGQIIGTGFLTSPTSPRSFFMTPN
jgi:probable HAF family extracellular repeat protein